MVTQNTVRLQSLFWYRWTAMQLNPECPLVTPDSGAEPYGG
jgi:hypothetical protein